MVDLVSLDEAKDRLGINFASKDELVTNLTAQAQDIVIGYIKKPDHGWTADTVPERIKAAILMALIRLWAGDDGPILTDAVKAILHRDRDPALA